MVITALLKLDWLQKMLSVYKTQNKHLRHSFTFWCELKPNTSRQQQLIQTHFDKKWLSQGTYLLKLIKVLPLLKVHSGHIQQHCCLLCLPLRAMHSPSVLLVQTAVEIPHFGEKPTEKQSCGQVFASSTDWRKSSQVVTSPVLPL